MKFTACRQIGSHSYHMIRNPLRSLVVGFVLLAWLGTTGVAQNKSNEVELLLGGSIVPTSTTGFNINSGLAYQATYAHRFTGDRSVGWGFEVPFVALPGQDVQSPSPSSPRNHASIIHYPRHQSDICPYFGNFSVGQRRRGICPICGEHHSSHRSTEHL